MILDPAGSTPLVGSSDFAVQFPVLCHVGSAVLLILILFKHGFLDPLRRPGALRIDVRSPEMRDGVFDDEENGDSKRPDEPVGAAGNPVLDGLSFAVGRLLNVVGRGGPSVDKARKANLHDSAVGEVNGETVTTHPHEHLVREHALQAGRQPDARYHQIPADGGEPLGVRSRARRDDPVANVLELHRPAGPLPVLARKARDVPADNDQCGENGSASSRVAVDEIAEALLGSNIAEHDAVEELAFEGFCASQHGGSFRGAISTYPSQGLFASSTRETVQCR